MGFLDRAKKLADQAREKAEEALAEAKAKAAARPQASTPSPAGDGRDPRWGTPYVPGMLGRPGWREQGLTDPAAVLPVKAREQVGVPHSTKSEVVEEPYGMGRRWTSGGRSVGLFYRVHADHRAWAGGASYGGRELAFLGQGDRQVVLETAGVDDAGRAVLTAAVLANLEE
ncbi:MAG TPA: hypothetical protein VL337_13570 [Acidimicrobiales bacterium]|jgi:hypothetical protein|nr:hypothetical protein [Acidimicrobiales bacterium]